MSRRNTISREFFSTIAVVLVLGLSVMCAIQTALSAAYFVQERRTAQGVSGLFARKFLNFLKIYREKVYPLYYFLRKWYDIPSLH